MHYSSRIKVLFTALILLATFSVHAQQIQEGALVRVVLNTGSDDLRGGNTAFLKINRLNGTSTEEFVLGGGFGQNSAVEKDIPFQGLLALSEIRSITIRHDGSPKGPFDSYDNWDLQAISVVLVADDGNSLNVYNSVNDRNRVRFVQRFTGDRRTITLYRQRTPGQ